MRPFSYLRLALIVVLPISIQIATAARTIVLRNTCPQDISWFESGQARGSIPAGTSVTETFDDSFSGVLYTSANGGNTNGAGAVKVGFYGPAGYYYVVKDAPALNAGVTVVPTNQANARPGFCGGITCDSRICANAYGDLPTSFPAPSSTSPPSPPLFACPGAGVGFTVTFCPERTFPPSGAFSTVHLANQPGKCIDVRGATYRDGTPVQIYDCNGSGAQRWTIPRGQDGLVSAAGTGFCLDAGSSAPPSGTPLVIRPCVNGSASQTWQFTSSNQLKHASTNQCVDLRGGISSNGNPIQTWTCAAGNPNQIWAAS